LVKSLRLAVIGAGSRGRTLGGYLLEHPEAGRVTHAVDVDPQALGLFAEAFGLPSSACFADWHNLLGRRDEYDAVLISTPDNAHYEPVLAFLGLKVPILLEKPMSLDESECRQIVAAANAAGSLFAVCHVLLYTVYTQRVKSLMEDGSIGEIMSFQHLEPVGFWHQAHSFVRGNWRSTRSAAFMLLQKCCHDLDWLRHILGRRVARVSSFGALSHFRPENQPIGASDRCDTCLVEAGCPYSATRLYLGRYDSGDRGWPLDVVTKPVTREGLKAALRTGPYGRCVYASDNDVVDHQVVAFDYEGGVSGSLTMTAFTEFGDRRTVLFGTRGEMRLNGRSIEIYDYLTGTTRAVEVTVPGGPSVAGGHGGGDYGLMEAFCRAWTTGDSSAVCSNADTSLESHLVAFAAERARTQGVVVALERGLPLGRTTND